MTRRSCLAAVMACLCLTATVAMAEQYYRYSPQAITPDQKQGGDGVVVKEIPIQKGDTLYDLSRKYSGKGYYYPQILLFNDIKNPDRIYTGDLVRIPLGVAAADEQQPAAASQNKKHGLPSRKKSRQASSKKDHAQGSAAELSLTDLQRLDGKAAQANAASAQRTRKKPVIKAASSRSRARDVAEAIPASLPSPEEMPVIKNPPVMPETVAATSPNGQKIFEQALKAFRRDDFGGALELFDRFLADSPNSPLAADANLYRAECYLKQSGL